jgi:hypothetical protein
MPIPDYISYTHSGLTLTSGVSDIHSKRTLRFIKNQKAFNAHPGDYVEVFRKAESYEDGWMTCWVPPMDEAIGHIGVIPVMKFDLKFGLPVIIPEVNHSQEYWYPYTCLKILR